MDLLKSIVQVIVAASAILCAISSLLLFVRLRWPAPVLWILKLMVAALSPLFILIGLMSGFFGLFSGSLFITMAGLYTAVIFFIHFLLVTRPPQHALGFERAFGPKWKESIDTNTKRRFLPRRAVLRLPQVVLPRFVQNIAFATVPETGRELLCDIWRPSPGVAPSGLTFIYLHGSAFFFLDKDCGTRPFFTHLTAQGHMIMDVAYRLSPETDITGMVNDVNRAIAWVKENAYTYGVNPDKIVLGGGSSGGHLALLTGYTQGDRRFLPRELERTDVSVRAVISMYGTSDLKALYYHTNQHLTTSSVSDRHTKAVPTRMPEWLSKRMGQDFHRLGFDKRLENAGALAPLLGGHPDECPETYALLSPVTHVHAGCPPTLLIHGAHDIMAPVWSTRELYAKLTEAKVPTVMHILPQTDHAFDMLLPKWSPSAHTLFYDVERFLALQNADDKTEKVRVRENRELQYK